MGIPVKLEVFEGPLDLLLHLIDKNKIDIYDIPIVLITGRYMEYIKELEANVTNELNMEGEPLGLSEGMEVVSEFLVMAATLIKIKSKMLLPPDEVEEDEDEDPRAELVRCLLEYKMYKYASLELRDKQLDASLVVYKKASIPDEIADYKETVDLSALLSDLTLNKLHGIFRSIMKKQIDKIDPIRSQFGTIKKVEVSLVEQIAYIEEYAKEHKEFSFRGLLEKQKGKTYLIVTFLGILELIKIGKLWIAQDDMFDDIRLTYQEEGQS
jgi:segregation and condensation protein A